MTVKLNNINQSIFSINYLYSISPPRSHVTSANCDFFGAWWLFCFTRLACPWTRIILQYTTLVSRCPWLVRVLSVRLSVANMRTKRCDCHKKQFRAMVSIDEVIAYMGFSKTRYWTHKIQDGGRPPYSIWKSFFGYNSSCIIFELFDVE